MVLTVATTVAAAAFGLAIGSFLDVVAYRLPRKGSLLQPGSHCPSCQTSLRWRDNVPVLSWLALRGRCHTCGAAIPVRVVVVEALTAVAFAAVAVAVGHSWSIPGLCLLVATALAVAAAAADDASLPAAAVLVATLLGALGLVPAALVDGHEWGRLVDAGLGGVAGGLVTAVAPLAARYPAAGRPERRPLAGAAGTIQVLLPAGTMIGWFGTRGALGALGGVALAGVATAMVTGPAAFVARGRRRHAGRAPETGAASPGSSTARWLPATQRAGRLLIAAAGIAAMAGALFAVPASTGSLSGGSTVSSSSSDACTSWAPSPSIQGGCLARTSGSLALNLAGASPDEAVQDATGTKPPRPVWTMPRRSSMTFRSWGLEAAAMASRRSTSCRSSSSTRAWSKVSMP